MATVATVTGSVRTAKYLRTVGLGVIHGIPSAAPELTDLIARLHEKHVEESIRAIWKQGAKDTKPHQDNVDI
jgi:hypothetical protein